MGLNGIDGIPYGVVNRWSEFVSIIKQFTDASTVKRAREIYSTIIIDEVYATSLYCQDYVCSNYGNGALTMADGDSTHNLYSIYEKLYFKQINLLVSAGYTVVFIAHEQMDSKTKYVSPKGDKRCIAPIIDKCDYVVYLKSNGVDEEGKVIKSSAYLAETKEFFARARIEYTPTFIKEFTAENLERAIQIGIDKKRELDNATIVTFEEQKKLNYVEDLDFETLKSEFNKIISSIPGSSDYNCETKEGAHFLNYWQPMISQVVEKHLGKGRKVSQCNSNQVEAMSLIIIDLKELVKGEGENINDGDAD